MRRILKKIVKQNIDKKCSGVVYEYLPALITILILMVSLLLYINITADINVSNNCNMMVRKYILRMEAEGGLTDSTKNAIVADVKNIPNVIDDSVVVTGTSASSTSYGDTIFLKIECDYYATSYKTYEETNSIVGAIGRKDRQHVVATEQSTAKK